MKFTNIHLKSIIFIHNKGWTWANFNDLGVKKTNLELAPEIYLLERLLNS